MWQVNTSLPEVGLAAKPPVYQRSPHFPKLLRIKDPANLNHPIQLSDSPEDAALDSLLTSPKYPPTPMPLNLSPQGIATFNNVYQVATAAILNLFGSSETSTTSGTDPSFGKTPDALQMQAQRENTRDTEEDP